MPALLLPSYWCSKIFGIYEKPEYSRWLWATMSSSNWRWSETKGLDMASRSSKPFFSKALVRDKSIVTILTKRGCCIQRIHTRFTTETRIKNTSNNRISKPPVAFCFSRERRTQLFRFSAADSRNRLCLTPTNSNVTTDPQRFPILTTSLEEWNLDHFGWVTHDSLTSYFQSYPKILKFTNNSRTPSFSSDIFNLYWYSPENSQLRCPSSHHLQGFQSRILPTL